MLSWEDAKTNVHHSIQCNNDFLMLYCATCLMIKNTHKGAYIYILEIHNIHRQKDKWEDISFGMVRAEIYVRFSWYFWNRLLVRGKESVLKESLSCFASISPVVLHCQEKVLNLMTSKLSTSLKISDLLNNNINDWLKHHLKAHRLHVEWVKRRWEGDRGHGPWQFAGYPQS